MLRRLAWSRWHWMIVVGLVAGIEQEVERETGQQLEEVTDSIKIRQRRSIGFGVIAHTASQRYPKGCC